MPVDILLTVIVTSVVQSIFGVGVLLFGTPLLLLLGYDFLDALITLLPISIAINSFQILKHYNHIDLSFYKNVLFYTIPQARHYFCESLFWASQPKQAAKITWQLMPTAPQFVLRS